MINNLVYKIPGNYNVVLICGNNGTMGLLKCLFIEITDTLVGNNVLKFINKI